MNDVELSWMIGGRIVHINQNGMYKTECALTSSTDRCVVDVSSYHSDITQFFLLAHTENTSEEDINVTVFTKSHVWFPLLVVSAVKMMSVDNNGIDHGFSLVAQLTSIGHGLTHHQFETLVLAGQILELPRFKLSEVARDCREQNFTGLYRLIEEKNPQTAASIVYQLLIRVGFPRPKLDGLKQFIIKEDDDFDSNKELDLMLTISFILGNMNETCYSTFKEAARRTFLAEYAPDRITSPIHLIDLLMNRDSLSLEYLYAWLYISGASLYHRNLKQFCERQGLPEPNWDTLINNQEYGNIQLLDFSESNFIMVQHPRILTKLKCKDLKQYTYLPCLVILVVLLLVFLGCMTLFGYELSNQKNATNTTYYIGSNTTAKLACYDSNEIQSVIITPNDDTSKGAIMYATQDEPSTVDVLLPSEVIWPSPPWRNNKRIDGSAQLLTINYYNKKTHLTYAAEGVITYTVKLNYIPVNPTECPFRIYVFNSVNDYDLFFAAVSNGEDTNHIPHTNTSCFRDNGTYILDFTLYNNFYLFVMRPVENILVGINASANLTHYVMPSNTKGCTLNKQCTFNFTFQAINSKWCIYGSSDNLSQSEVNVTSIAISWTFLIKFSLSIGILVFAVCLFTLLMMVTCICVHLTKQYRAVQVYDIIN